MLNSKREHQGYDKLGDNRLPCWLGAGVNQSSVTLSRESYTLVMLTVFVPKDAGHDNYTIEVKGTSGNDDTAFDILELKVKGYCKLM